MRFKRLLPLFSTGDSSTGDSSNPLDGVRDLIMQAGPKLFDPSNLGRIDDLFREAGSDVYERMGPILGEVWNPYIPMSRLVCGACMSRFSYLVYSVES